MVNQNPAPESSNYFHPGLLRKYVCKRLQEPSIFLTVCWVSFCALIWETIVGLPVTAKLPHCIFTDLCRGSPPILFLTFSSVFVLLCPCFCIFLKPPSLPQSVSPPCFCLLSQLRLPCRWFFVGASQRGWGQCGLKQTHKHHHINFSCLHCLQNDMVLALNMQG